MTIKVLSVPDIKRMEEGESGIHTVVRKYYQHAKKFDIEFVDKDQEYDLVAAHAGITGSMCDVAHLHGIYFTGDYPATMWQHVNNKNIVNAIRNAKTVTVPSTWVREIFQRDMRFSPHVLPHGVDWDEWQHSEPTMNWVLGYAKNRSGQDVCDPSYLSELARKFPRVQFKSTFHPDGAPVNVDVTGVIPYNDMKLMTQRSSVFVQAVKETFGLHALEACAAGVPIAAYNHGGVRDFVFHGVNGYLAEPGNIDDLAEGVAYCLQYRSTLSANSREIARRWTWENAVKRLSEIYQLSLKIDDPTTAVIIPIYNKEKTLERAVKSALAQTRPVDLIVLIDDGSTDDSGKIGKRLEEEYPEVEYYYQDNAGVANARNEGIRLCDGFKYVCCLDADDAIAPTFIETCLNALESNNELHLAYTKILAIQPDGKSGISKWPGEWDFDKQMRPKGNQVPTCCVFRKETFDRLGGYRSRYAPMGCGSEDAALWTMFGIHGYKCALVSEEPLFIYSLGVGGTSQPGYSEVDYLQLYPSVYDGLHPFASYKKPVNDIAHPVFQYDEPIISVIIPVGPGHMDVVTDALDSVESQRGFRKWEVIVVNDTGEPFPGHILKSYPYIRVHNTEGFMGPGHARNRGADMSRGKFLVFLDADDMMLPDFMRLVTEEWGRGAAIVYTNYLGSAYISEEEAVKQRDLGKLRSYNGPDKPSVLGFPTREPRVDFDCEAAQAMPRFPLYHWCLVTCLIPKAWHEEINGFDENMESWEDVDYHWRMAWAGKCYTRVPEELIMYRLAMGNRRYAASADTEEGRQIGRKLLRYIDKKKESINMSPCPGGCGGRRSQTIVTRTPTDVSRVTSVQQSIPNDQDFELYFFTSPKRGDHRLIGGNVFPSQLQNVNMIKAEGGGFRIDYGYHSSGEPRPFLVHRLDVQVNPGLFQKATLMREAPPVERPKPEAPKPVDVSSFAQETPDNRDPLANLANTTTEIISKPLTDEELGKIHKFADAQEAIAFLEEDEPFDPQTIPGVTAGIAAQLDGKTLEDLKAMSHEDWVSLRGVADVKADLIMQYLANSE